MGAEVAADGVRFGVWAPRAAAVTVVIESGGEHALAAAGDGFFAACVATARAGDRYSAPDPNGARYSGVVSGAKPWRMMFSVTTRGTRNWSR